MGGAISRRWIRPRIPTTRPMPRASALRADSHDMPRPVPARPSPHPAAVTGSPGGFAVLLPILHRQKQGVRRMQCDESWFLRLAAGGLGTHPDDLAGGEQAVEHRRTIVAHPCRQYGRFPYRGRQGDASSCSMTRITPSSPSYRSPPTGPTPCSPIRNVWYSLNPTGLVSARALASDLARMRRNTSLCSHAFPPSSSAMPSRTLLVL